MITETETTNTIVKLPTDIQALIDSAIEHNMNYLLLQHSNPTKLMNTLRNMAIDNAFQEVSQRLDNIEAAHEISISNVTATLLKLDLKIKKLEGAQP
ncbi:MAG: hypothetical protein WC365_08345 [Candidatus Babeliales bacterium]